MRKKGPALPLFLAPSLSHSVQDISTFASRISDRKRASERASERDKWSGEIRLKPNTEATMQTEAAAKQPSWACDSKHDMHPSNLQQDEHLVSASLGTAGKSSTWHTSKAWHSQTARKMFPSSFSYVGFPFMSLSGAGKVQNSQDADEVEALESSIDEVQALEPSIFRGKKDQKQGAMSWLFDGRLAQGCRGHMTPQTLGMEAIPLQTPNKLLQPHANERDIEDRGQKQVMCLSVNFDFIYIYNFPMHFLSHE